jgi:uncharacterized repeat protein (TIGR01451 family)
VLWRRVHQRGDLFADRGKDELGISVEAMPMNRHRGILIRRVAVLVQLVALSVFASASGVSFTGSVDAATTATGSLLKTVPLPATSPCASGGSLLTLVEGRLVNVNFATFPILLAVACPTSNTISFLDPNSSGATNPAVGASVVASVTTSTAPTGGWLALSARPDQGDMLGCGNVVVNNGELTSIQAQVFSIPNAIASGTSANVTPTLLFTADLGGGSCDGLAWDASDKTIYLAPTDAGTIFHFSTSGTQLTSFSGPSACQSSGGINGVMVAGSNLFVTCAFSSSVFQINKSNGAAVTSFSPLNAAGAPVAVDGMGCDPVSFAGNPNAALWARDVTANQVYALALPEFQCAVLFNNGVAAPFGPQCSATWVNPDGNPAHVGPGDTTSTAGDGLLDCWKVQGIFLNGGTNPDYVLPNAHLKQKDIYVELDSYASNVPPTQSIPNVVQAFKSAPCDRTVSPPIGACNPDGTSGINLHVEQFTLPSTITGSLAFPPCTTQPGAQDFDALKRRFFGSSAGTTNPATLVARAFVFHYAISAPSLQGLGTTSGCSELPGNDFSIALGGWSFSSSDLVQSWAGTIMHELGHNLGLRHGGGNGIDLAADGLTRLSANCKPNYLSVMNYALQMPDRSVPLASWKLDYSRIQLPTLNEGTPTAPGLNETTGVFGTAANQAALNGFVTAFGAPTKTGGVQILLPSASGAINWDGDRSAPPGPPQFVFDNANNFGALSGCDGTGAQLAGFNDWANLVYAYQNTLDFDDGIRTVDTTTDAATGQGEITREESEAIVANTVPLISLTKTANWIGAPNPPSSTTRINYTLAATNQGPKTATNVSIVDSLPAGVDYLSNSVCPRSGGIVTCSVGNLGVGKTAAFTITIVPNQCCLLSNQAGITANPDPTFFQSNVVLTTALNFAFNGFFSPVQNPPMVNQVNAGSSIPLKFSLGGNFGMNIFAPGFPTQGTIDCTTLQPTGGMSTIPSGDVSLNFNIGAGQYNLQISTPMSWAGTCREIGVAFNDGTPPHFAFFQFK